MPRNVQLLIAALAALSACHRAGARDRAQKAPPGEVWLSAQQVKGDGLVLQEVAPREVGTAIITGGKVTFDDFHVSHVFSPVSGRVTKILAQLGEHVKKGAPLCTIESPDVGTAFSDLSKAQADLAAAAKDLRRQRDLYEVRATSERDFEAAQDAYDKALAELDRARQKARLLHGDSVDRVTQDYTLRALIDGEVISRSVNPGTEVQGLYSGGNPVELFTIGEIDEVWVLADLFEPDLARVHKGDPVTVRTVAYPDVFRGVVDWVSDALDPVSHTAKVRCIIRNPAHQLKPEMYVTVSIRAGGHRTLAIPRSALLRVGEQTMVFVQAGTTPNGLLRFERRPVHVGEEEGGEYLPVTHGLEPGDKVVVSGANQLLGML